MEVQRVLLVLVLVLVSVERSDCERCFTQFNLTRCQDAELGDVDVQDCCQNPQYGYLTSDGACQSCGPRVWSAWSPWSQCNNLRGNGTMQRSRECVGFGQSECENAEHKLETKACRGTCNNGEGWGSWLAWSSCSVTCGGGGVRKRERVCTGPPECRLACSGQSEETESCPTTTCPVHGGWSTWSGWSPCSGSCIDDQHGDVIVPTKERRRSCSNPAPSGDTVPPGNSCHGDSMQAQPCSELPNCPVNGGWGAWSPPGLCSVTCGAGLQLSSRSCDQPRPKYGGQYCDGQSTNAVVCQSPCPVDGLWTGWSSWGECSSSCIPQNQVPTRTRHRSCSNPAPSSRPPGNGCQGEQSQTERCPHLSHCPVDGSWGSWSSFSSCPVTCGVGLAVSTRKCDSPAPIHGGQTCSGKDRQIRVCKTEVHCPVDGIWSQWSRWTACRYRNTTKPIRCTTIGGTQHRERFCLHRKYNGSICTGLQTDTQVCYDVRGCSLKGSWDEWAPWGLCNPPCGPGSRRTRPRVCHPDYKGYKSTIGHKKEPATFHGIPNTDCGPTPDGGDSYQIQSCDNAPACL